MALRSGYKGFKKLLPGLKFFRPGTLGIDNNVLIPELNKIFFPRSEQAVLGAKNLLQNTGVSGTSSGVSFVVNADKSVTCSNTASGGNGQFTVNADLSYLPKNTPLILSGFPSTGTASKKMFVRWADGGNTVYKVDQGEGVTFSIPSTATNIVCLIVYSDGQTANETVYPMIRLATDPDDTYAPYAMTNRELTEIKTGTVSEYTNSYASFNTASAFLVSRAGVKQLYMFVTISTVAPNDEWIQIATLSEAPTKAITGINVPWDSALGSARSFVYQIDTSGKVYIRAKAAISSIISETFI